MKLLFVWLQYLIPQHLLSRFIGSIADCRWSWLKKYFIQRFVLYYKINMQEAEIADLTAYASFNDFFTRRLRPKLRIIAENPNTVVSPVDGVISQFGTIHSGRIIQAKGRDYSVAELLAGDTQLGQHFMQGSFITLYLAPRHYHRVHMPCAGELLSMIYVPGKLFSVNPLTAERVPNLFARNERIVCLFKTEMGLMAVVMVGAMIVASMETVWAKHIPISRKIRQIDYGPQNPIILNKGDEMGRFKLGSTVILLFANASLTWSPELKAEMEVQLGKVLIYNE